MGAAQRRKGGDGERELCRLLAAELGTGVSRNLNQCRDGGSRGDLLGLAGLCLEVKRAAQPRLWEWWQQSVDQAAQCSAIPALAYRLDRQPWRFVLPLAALADALADQPAPLDLTAELSLTGFCLLVRERLSGELRPLREQNLPTYAK